MNYSPCKCVGRFPLIVITHHHQGNLQKKIGQQACMEAKTGS